MTVEEKCNHVDNILYKKYGVLDFETFIPVFHKHPIAHREYIDKLLEEYNSAA